MKVRSSDGRAGGRARGCGGIVGGCIDREFSCLVVSRRGRVMESMMFSTTE